MLLLVPLAAGAAGLLGCLFLVLLLVLGMGWGGDRSRPGGKKPGRKPRMDDESIMKRAERQASKQRTALRKAAKAAAAVREKEEEQRKAAQREQLKDQVMCVRRLHGCGSERIADVKAAAAVAPEAAAPAAAAAQPTKGTLHSFFVKPPA